MNNDESAPDESVPDESVPDESVPDECRPTSEARIAANRVNAQHSTGPRSAEGKARSSRSSTVHGAYAVRPDAISRGAFAEDADEVECYLRGWSTRSRRATRSRWRRPGSWRSTISGSGVWIVSKPSRSPTREVSPRTSTRTWPGT